VTARDARVIYVLQSWLAATIDPADPEAQRLWLRSEASSLRHDLAVAVESEERLRQGVA
jgi:hypothetical protein